MYSYFDNVIFDEDGLPVDNSDGFYDSQEDYDGWQDLIDYWSKD